MLVSCAICEATVDAKEVGSIEVRNPDDILEAYRYTLLSCPRCDQPVLVRQGAEIWQDGGKWEQRWDENPVRVFPDPDRRADQRLPVALRDCFQEALDCYRARLFHAAALMCRKTLEGLCQLKGADKGGLAIGLRQLHEKGIIEARLFEWAQALREDGNLAAHELEARVTREDAVHIVDFTEAILEYVFILSDKFGEYQQLRAKRPRKGRVKKSENEEEP